MADTIVLGLDGANWGVTDRWLGDGLLPGIQRLRGSGVTAVSKSEYPPVICSNWKYYLSGKNPWANACVTKFSLKNP